MVSNNPQSNGNGKKGAVAKARKRKPAARTALNGHSKPQLRLEWRNADELAENPRNWRTHPEGQTNALQAALGEVGWAGALLYNERTERLIDGHARKKLKTGEKVPVLIGSWSEADEAKILATLDPIGAMAGANAAALDSLLRDVQTVNKDLASMLTDLAEANPLPTPEVTEDEAPEPPVNPVSRTGDLWIMGEHRLLCGDSTKAEDVSLLMGGEKASCIFTDPPYGVSIAAKNRTLNSDAGGKGGRPSRNECNIADDDLTPEQLEASLHGAFVNVREIAMAEDCTLFVCSPQGCGLSMMMMMMMMQNAGLKARHVLIWVKNQPTFSMGRLDYDYQHEPILLTWLKRHKRPMAGKHRTSVWNIDKPRASPEHPTMKPVELYANAYANNSSAGDVVADPYSGSGTAIVAAEQLGRKCRSLEIDPRYIDVAVLRWQKLTGQSATLDGRMFEEVKEERHGDL